MKEIKLLKLRISNFKGIRELEIAFDGKDMNILGDNGTGKTSIIDSFTWLLFGKDSLERAEFGIKPTDSAGNIVHHLETEVEAVFDISGTEKVFKKTLSEVWTRKRGAAEAEFTRNENNFYIDGVPKKKSEYTAAINEFIDEEVFKIVTNPLYFNERINWKDRRNVLLAICGEISDEEVINAHPELSPLLNVLQGKSVSDFKEITASKMKSINRELDMIPVKINEAERAKPDAEALEVDTVRKAQLTQAIEELRTDVSNIQNGAEIEKRRAYIGILKRNLDNVGKGFSEKRIPEYESLSQLSRESQDIKYELSRKERHVKSLKSDLNIKSRARSLLSKDWDKVSSERFTDSVCPTCGRELPDEEVETRRNIFNSKKAQRLDEIEATNKKYGEDCKALEKEIDIETARIVELNTKLDTLNAQISEANTALGEAVKAKEIEFEHERAKLNADIEEVESHIKKYEENSAEEIEKLNAKIEKFSAELAVINEAIANKALVERQDKRIEELREQQKRLVVEYSSSESDLYLAELFIVAKVNMLDERINRKFKYAKFKLFDKQINGGINEVCEVTYNGIPYKDLNNAMRINIGIDLINTLSQHYGVSAPIMTDNAESVNEMFHTDAQQIRFYVSLDKKLVFNKQEDK